MKACNTLSAIVVMVALVSVSILTMAQDNEKKSVNLSLSYTQVNQLAPMLKVNAKSKVGKKFEPVEGIEVAFFLGEASDVNRMGTVVTDRRGNGTFSLPSNFAVRADSMETMMFTGTSVSNKGYEASDASVEVSRARIRLTLAEQDSVRKIFAQVLAKQDGVWKVVPGADVKLFVKRLFSDLPVGDDIYVTDDNGNVSGDFQITIPGDPQGSIIVGAKLEDNDIYGTVIAAKTVKWGTPLPMDNSFNKRTLWATRNKTPVWLLIFPNLIIVSVWGFIVYLFVIIRRIRKIGMTQPTH